MQRTVRFAVLLASALLMLAVGPAQAGGNPSAGKQKSQTCTACHGPDGNSDNPIYPRLAGQHESYLYYVLRTYKSGQRKNAVMNGMVSQLSDQDLQDLAAYYASQKGLYTVPLDRDAAAE